MKIYLDYAAATPMDKAVSEAMSEYLSKSFYNPSSSYLSAQTVKKALNDARKQVAHWLGAKPAEIIFTAGATESDNLAIQGVMDRFPGANVVISAIEHEAVVQSAAKYNCKTAPVDSGGRVQLPELEGLIDDQTVLVSIIYANNEIGTIQSLSEIAQSIAGVRKKRRQQGNDLPIYLHSDAVQATNYLDLHVSKLGVDLLTLSGAKIYGPKQVGCLYVRSGVELEPQVLGGGQEKSLRGGTENVAGIIGFATAMELVQSTRHEEVARVKKLRDQLLEIIQNTLKDAGVAGTMKKRLPNNLNVHFPDVDGERLVMELDEKGVMVATGAACEASSDEPSHVLKALGLDDDAVRSSLRISLGRGTDKFQIKQAGKTIVDVVNRVRQN